MGILCSEEQEQQRREVWKNVKQQRHPIFWVPSLYNSFISNETLRLVFAYLILKSLMTIFIKIIHYSGLWYNFII